MLIKPKDRQVYEEMLMLMKNKEMNMEKYRIPA
jgi:hypothetical protein